MLSVDDIKEGDVIYFMGYYGPPVAYIMHKKQVSWFDILKLDTEEPGGIISFPSCTPAKHGVFNYINKEYSFLVMRPKIPGDYNTLTFLGEPPDDVSKYLSTG